MRIDFKGTPSLEDQHQAQWLNIRSAKSLLLLAAMTGLLLFMSIPRYAVLGLYAFFPFMLFAVMLAVGYWALRLKTKSHWEKFPAVQEELTGHADEDRLVLHGKTWNERRKWEEFVRVTQTPELLVLHEKNRLMRTLPRRFFASDVDWRNFQRLIERHVLKK